VEPNRAAFCRDLRVDRTTLQKIEDGDRSPTVFLVVELSHRLCVSTDYILKGSLMGVDGELAARLIEAHPELLDHNRTATGGGTDPSPRRRAGKK
jgi:DNA-binding XRE family transcriptional regulator